MHYFSSFSLVWSICGFFLFGGWVPSLVVRYHTRFLGSMGFLLSSVVGGICILLMLERELSPC